MDRTEYLAGYGIREVGDYYLELDNALHTGGTKLRIERVRGILHFGVMAQNGTTEWADINADSLVEALRDLGVV